MYTYISLYFANESAALCLIRQCTSCDRWQWNMAIFSQPWWRSPLWYDV